MDDTNDEYQKKVKEIFDLLEKIKEDMQKFKELDGRKISLRSLEEKYGEYFVANQLIENGIKIKEKIGRGKEADIVTTTEVRVEVKTSRKTQRFTKAKIGYGWLVKERQWKTQKFDYLVCVAIMDTSIKILAFTYDQVIKYFSERNFRMEAYRTVIRNGKGLDLIDGGLVALISNYALAKERIE